MKNLLLSMLITSLFPYMISCTFKTKEDVAAQEASFTEEQTVTTEEITVQPIIEQPIDSSKVNYFLSSEIGLPSGTVVGFAPSDETIDRWESPNQEQIYIRIMDNNGNVHIYECDHKVWVNVYKGDIIK